MVSRDPMDRPLYRWPDRVFRLMVLTGCLVLTTWPAAAGLLVLVPEVGNVVPFAVVALPVGPGLVAALYAARKLADGDDAATWTMFWKGYRLGWRDGLRVWAPVVAAVVVLVVDVAWLRAQGSGLAAAAEVMLPVGLVLAAPWVLNALTLASWFSFRTRDLARLGGYYTVTKPVPTVGLLLVVAALGAVVVAWSDWAGYLLLGVAAYAVAVVTGPMVDHAQATFVAPTPAAGDGA